ncbi:MAG: DUF2330 domain-containing protein [Candidatus Bathyarchaeota archaeon]|nr:DUF2330 domain-containing protein [Candidatus Bathyarchaeota archaeon]
MKPLAKTSSASIVLSVALLLLLPETPLLASADRGGIPLYPTVDILEPGQKAIVAWNGREEILILSTDVKANQTTLVLELLPLPSNPKAIEKANFTSFTKLQEIIERHTSSYARLGGFQTYGADNFSSVVVTFHEKIGAHDITVVKADSASELAFWVDDFLSKNNATTELSLQEYEVIFEDYISRGFPYFALDLVELSPDDNTVEPILYCFETDFLYYPLKISSLFSGDTNIMLFLLTQQPFSSYILYRPGAGLWATSAVYVENNQTKLRAPADFSWSPGNIFRFRLSNEEVMEIDSRLGSLFDDSALLTVLEYRGPLDIFSGDLTLREGEELLTYPFVSPVPLSTVDYEGTPLDVSHLKLIPSTLITAETLERIAFTTPHEVIVLVDYFSPVIGEVSQKILIEGAVSIGSQVQDPISGVRNVTLFYKAEEADEQWVSITMNKVGDGFEAKIPVKPYGNLNFYIEVSDSAGNRAVEDNDGSYYLVNVTSQTTGIILRNSSLVLTCILAAGLIAFLARICVKRIL